MLLLMVASIARLPDYSCLKVVETIPRSISMLVYQRPKRLGSVDVRQHMEPTGKEGPRQKAVEECCWCGDLSSRRIDGISIK